MVDARSVVQLVFEGVDQTGLATASALRNVDSFGASVSSAAEPLANFTASAIKLEAALLATGAAILAASVSMAGDFQSAVIDLQKVLSDNEDIEEFKQLALDLSAAYGVAATDVLSSIADFKQAGFTALEAGELTKASMDLVIAGGIGAEQASVGLVQALKGFGSEAGEATRIVDLLNAVSNEYGANVEQLLEGFSRLSPIASTANLSLEETVGILTPAIEVFQSGSEAANGLRTVLLRMVDDSKPVQDALRALGVSQTDTNGAFRSARDIFFDVSQAMVGLDQNQQIVIASQLVGVEQATKFLAVLNNMPTVLRIAGDGFQYLGSAQKEVDAQLAGFDTRVDRLTQSFVNFAIQIGSPLLDESASIADAIGKIFEALSDSVLREDQLGALVSYMEGLLSEISDNFAEFARNLPDALGRADLSGFVDGLDAVVAGIRQMFSGLELDTVDGVRKAIESLGGAFGLLGEYTGSAIAALKPLIDILFDAAAAGNEINLSWVAWAGTIGGLALIVAPIATAVSSVATAALLAGPALATLGARLAFLSTIKVAAVAGLLATIAVNAKDIYDATKDLIDANERIEEFDTDSLLQFNSEEVARKLQQISEELGYTVTSYEEFERAVADGALVFDETTGRWVSAINAVSSSTDDLVANMDGTTGSAKDLNTALSDTFSVSGYNIDPLTGAVTRITEGTQQAAEAAGLAQDATRGYIMEIVEGVPTFRQLGSAASSGFGEARDAAIEAAKASETYLIEMEKIASNERIKFIEAKFELDVATVEADAKRIQAAFESIDNTVNSTGELLGSLFDLLGDASRWDRLEIFDQIEQENRRRDEALELQKQLTEAEIKLLRARAESLERGDSLIQIDGAGLAPHLEAFMWEILRAIQVRVNEDGLDLLLGTS